MEAHLHFNKTRQEIHARYHSKMEATVWRVARFKPQEEARMPYSPSEEGELRRGQEANFLDE